MWSLRNDLQCKTFKCFTFRLLTFENFWYRRHGERWFMGRQWTTSTTDIPSGVWTLISMSETDTLISIELQHHLSLTLFSHSFFLSISFSPFQSLPPPRSLSSDPALAQSYWATWLRISFPFHAERTVSGSQTNYKPLSLCAEDPSHLACRRRAPGAWEERLTSVTSGRSPFPCVLTLIFEMIVVGLNTVSMGDAG